MYLSLSSCMTFTLSAVGAGENAVAGTACLHDQHSKTFTLLV